jgi:Kef-type K+ transport system membrane component KefB
MQKILWLLLALSFVAVMGKWVGAGLGARWAGFTWREASQLGAGMISRGEVGLILASVGLRQSLLSEREFSAIIGMVLISTLITPPLLRYLFTEPKPRPILEKKTTPE